jgi:hypothetical protein
MLPSPYLHAVIQEALRPAPRAPHPRPEPPVAAQRPAPVEPVTIRWAGAADRPALEALAALDGASLPTAPMLVAERDGVPVAALAADGSDPIADPFSPTAELVDLLEVRARQLFEGERARRGSARRTLGRLVSAVR